MNALQAEPLTQLILGLLTAAGLCYVAFVMKMWPGTKVLAVANLLVRIAVFDRALDRSLDFSNISLAVSGVFAIVLIANAVVWLRENRRNKPS